MSSYPELGLPLVHAGKVRELYDLGEHFLMVATDAVSAFDHVLPTPIPEKGTLLTQLSLWWFEQLGRVNHVVSTEVPALVVGRALVCEKLTMLPVECVARGYLTGSAWQEYRRHGTACGIELPAGLSDGSRLDEPIFTPATKAELGEHDENITFNTLVELIGAELAHRLRAETLAIYQHAHGFGRERGLVLADTKLEFGTRADGTLVLADEVLTPDSSRWWDAELWEAGRLEPFDKQYLRDWLITDSGWDPSTSQPPPALPADVVQATAARYREAYRRLTSTAAQRS